MNADRRCPEPILEESHAALRAALYMRVSTGGRLSTIFPFLINEAS
jgi:hypothetical protein